MGSLDIRNMHAKILELEARFQYPMRQAFCRQAPQLERRTPGARGFSAEHGAIVAR